MSERSERLLDLLGQVDDRKIDEAADFKPAKKWTRWTAAAAALALVVGLGGAVLLPHLGASAGNGGHEGGSVFMSYAGPVFPMTLREKNEIITAERGVTLDFQPWVPRWETVEEMLDAPEYRHMTKAERKDLRADLRETYPDGGTYRRSDHIRVEDVYTLTNGSEEDQTVSVLYPFAGELRYLEEQLPSLALDGKTVKTTLYAGGYPGSFGPADGDREHPEDTVNLEELSSWEGYRDRMESGAYRMEALADGPDLSQLEATVYKITLPSVKTEDGEGSPNTRVTFRYDPAQTRLLNSGFHGFTVNDDGSYTFLAGRNSAENQRKTQTCYLICLGGELTDLTLDDRAGGGWDPDTPKLDCKPGQVKTYTTSLGQAVDQVLKQPFLPDAPKGRGKLVRGVVWEQIHTFILQDQIQRYNYGSIDDVYSDALSMKRVFWLEGEITVPAGQSVMVEASMEKKPSYDFTCTGGENRGVNGYDMLTTLDSNLKFSQQTAALEDRGQIQIVRQNFGFDLEGGITRVKLDLENPHYYLEVRRQENPDPVQ